MSEQCDIQECENPSRGKHGLCNKHRLRMQRHGRVEPRPTVSQLQCVIEDCEQPQRSKGLCDKHYTRRAKNGSPLTVAFHRESHGLAHHPLYGTWQNMRRRCESPKATGYELYGGRGIQVCDRWRTSFSAFLDDVGERPDGCTLDRVDTDGDYEPGNVRWATQSVQSKNQRIKGNNRSGHKGVCWDSSHSRWRAYTGGGSSRIELGYFGSFHEAVDARHRATIDDQHMRCCVELDRLRALRPAA